MGAGASGATLVIRGLELPVLPPDLQAGREAGDWVPSSMAENLTILPDALKDDRQSSLKDEIIDLDLKATYMKK